MCTEVPVSTCCVEFCTTPFKRPSLSQKNEIQGQIRQHSSSINTVGVRDPHRREQDREKCCESSKEMWLKGCRQKVRQGPDTSLTVMQEMPKDHRNETGSCGEPSNELWASTCSTSLTQW